MTDYIFPPHARISAEQLTVISNAAAARSIFTGATRTTSRAGGRLRFGISTSNAGDREEYSNKAALQAIIGRLDGQTHRLLFTDPGYVRRGSFPASELLLNNTFASGTTSWGVNGSNAVLSVSDRVMRVTRSSSSANPQMSQQLGVTQFVPYVFRSMQAVGRGSPTLFGFSENGTVLDQSSGPGMVTAVSVAQGVTLRNGVYDSASTGNAGDYFECPYTSLSRCALVDGGVNLLVRSEEFDNASWTKVNATVGANATAGPDGATTADSLIDDATSGSHSFRQSITVTSASQDIQVTFVVKAGSRNFASVDMTTTTGSASAFIDLTTGAISTITSSVAFTGPRAFARALGNGWWRFTVIALKTSLETTLTARVHSANVGTTVGYSGSANAAIFVARGNCSVSGVAARTKVTTTTAASTSESQVGNALHLKGLPASTADLLLPGDRVQIGTQLNIVTAPLDSDASGLGYLEFAFRLRASPADNAPVIIHQPFGRFIQTGNETGWDQQPGGVSNYEMQIEEALDA